MLLLLPIAAAAQPAAAHNIANFDPHAPHSAQPEDAADAMGRFVEIPQMTPPGLPAQRLTIWLPPGYDRTARRYPVLYMHDGHNLFDLAHSNFNKIWAADKAMLQAMRHGIDAHIIVGIWAPGADRYRQYLPQFAAERAEGALAQGIAQLAAAKPILSARYLEWLADELKPWVDRHYRTRSGAVDTAIAGSSMGGLMSCYAIVERPDIYGRAACVSAHWPMIFPGPEDASRAAASAIWTQWLAAKLGPANGRRVWMDHGTATLDQYYAPYQAVVDQQFLAAGWQRGSEWRSEVYVGAEHEENAWRDRLLAILIWLLAPQAAP